MERVTIRLVNGEEFAFKGTPAEVTRAIRAARKEHSAVFEIQGIDVTPSDRA